MVPVDLTTDRYGWTRIKNLYPCLSVFICGLLIPALLFGSAPLLFMTDFGVNDDSVAICKGVMLSVDPGLHIIDISHQVTPYSILDGARYLEGASPYFPAGS